MRISNILGIKSASLVFFIMLLVLFIVLGCSGLNGGAVSPDTDKPSQSADANSHQLWGLWQFKADLAGGKLEMTPFRAAEKHLDALRFLESPDSVYLSVDYLKIGGNQVIADIGLRHPFIGLDKFTGFDVCGVFITSGTVTGFDDPDLRMAGDGDTRLLNADGYTRWWNPYEFPVNDGTMFSYKDGLLGTPNSAGNYDCTLNGYKYYADGLDKEAALDTLDPTGRGVFSAGQKNVRRFIIKMESGLVFNYAVDASWLFPQGSPPYHVPDDFPPEANRPEAWNIKVNEIANTLWNDGTSSGGDFLLSIDVFDHFNADLNVVGVESPGNFNITTSGAPTGGGEGYSTYEVDIGGATPAPGSIDLLITVECEKTGYGNLLPGKTQAAYFGYTAQVGNQAPITGIFVDGDNFADPLEDGTMAHPYDTIQKGIDAAGVAPYEGIYDIYIDPFAGGDYATFTMKDDVQLYGKPWKAGTGKPEIILTQPWAVADNLKNCRLENFLITFNHTAQTSNELRLFTSTSSDHFTIEDCKFSGIMSSQISYFFGFTYCTFLTLEHNEFSGIRNKSTYMTDYHALYLIELSSCDDVLIRHNEYHDIGYDDEGPSTTNNTTHLSLWLMMYVDSGAPPDYCERVRFHNNLVYDITNYSLTDSVAVNYFTLLGWSAWIGYNTIPGFEWVNNTVDDVTEIADDENRRGNAFFCYGSAIDPGWIVKNSIISNMAPLSTAIYYNGHRGFWADSCVQQVPCNYCNCYNFGPVGHPQVRDYVNFFTKGVGSYGLADYQDPSYDKTSGPNFYHVTNSVLKSDDGSEMGAFGGPDGDWIAPSQE